MATEDNGSKVKIWVAIIRGGAIIIAAIIAAMLRSNNGNGSGSPTPTPGEDIPYAGRVIDKKTQELIIGATVFIDTRG
jgi:hypothetical protein